MARGIRLALTICALALCRTAPAQDAASGPGIHDTFEDGANGWQVLYKDGADNKTDPLTTTKKTVHSGQGALQFDYEIKPGGFRIAMRPIHQGDLAGAGTISFWVYSDHQATLTVMLSEHAGGQYRASFSAPRGEWQKVTLAPADFVLNTGANDPKDPDGKLDMDQIEGFGITDLAMLFAQSPEFLTLFSVPVGQHTVYIDDVEISAAKLPATVGIDDFARPQINWAVLGTASVARKTGPPIGGPSMQVDYQVAPARLLALAHSIAPHALAGKQGIAFSATASKAATFIVQFEDSEGGKFNTTIEVPAGSPKKFHIALNALKVADDSKSQDKLAVDKVTQVLLIDIAGISATAPVDNVLTLGPVDIE
jgi:hypothetical protein